MRRRMIYLVCTGYKVGEENEEEEDIPPVIRWGRRK